MITRMTFFIVILFYLVGLGFLLPAINQWIVPQDRQIGTNSQNQTLLNQDTQFNLITSITTLPAWFNIIFIVIPFILWIGIGISFFIPTINPGA